MPQTATDMFARKLQGFHEGLSIKKIFFKYKVSSAFVFTWNLRYLNRTFLWRNNPRSAMCLTTLQANFFPYFPSFLIIACSPVNWLRTKYKNKEIYFWSLQSSRREKEGKSPKSYLWSVEGIWEIRVKDQEVFKNEMASWPAVVKKTMKRKEWSLRMFSKTRRDLSMAALAIERSRFRITKNVHPIFSQNNVVKLTYAQKKTEQT